MKPNEVRVSDSERLSCVSTKIFIDNGHDIETPGKRSPDGKFLEYQYNRIIAVQVTSELVDCSYDAELLVPEETDISLRERVCRVNDKCDIFGVANVILISIHVNAAGSDGKWTKEFLYGQCG